MYYKSIISKIKKEKMHLDELNDDCLLYLFKYFNKIEDLYRIGLVCERFRFIVRSFSRKFQLDTRSIPPTDDQGQLTDQLEYCNSFFSIVGHHIATLNICNKAISQPRSRFEIIEKYCQYTVQHLRIAHWDTFDLTLLTSLLCSVKSLEIDQCDGKHINCAKSQDYLQQIDHLQALSLIDCAPNLFHDGGNEVATILNKSKELKHLRLINQMDILRRSSMRDAISQLTALECLSLSYGTTKDVDLRFLATLPSLKRLQLIDYDNYDADGSRSSVIVDELLVALVHNDSDLYELDLHHCHLMDRTYTTIAQFKKLKILKMNKNFWLTHEQLKLMATMRGQLTHFYCYDCLKLTNEAISEYLTRNQYLQFLDLSWCYMINDAGIRALSILWYSRQKVRRLAGKDAIKMNIVAGGRTNINRQIVEVYIFNILKNIYYSKNFFCFRKTTWIMNLM